MPDLKPLYEALERMSSAFDRLATAIEEQNRIATEALEPVPPKLRLAKAQPAFEETRVDKMRKLKGKQ